MSHSSTGVFLSFSSLLTAPSLLNVISPIGRGIADGDGTVREGRKGERRRKSDPG